MIPPSPNDHPPPPPSNSLDNFTDSQAPSQGTHTLLNTTSIPTHHNTSDTQHSIQTQSIPEKGKEEEQKEVSSLPQEMILVASPSAPIDGHGTKQHHRSSYLDMDDDDPLPSSSAARSAAIRRGSTMNPFRKFLVPHSEKYIRRHPEAAPPSTSAPPTTTAIESETLVSDLPPQIPAPATYPLRSSSSSHSNSSKSASISFPSIEGGPSATFTFPFVSPARPLSLHFRDGGEPASPTPAPGSAAFARGAGRRERPSLEGVFASIAPPSPPASSPLTAVAASSSIPGEEPTSTQHTIAPKPESPDTFTFAPSASSSRTSSTASPSSHPYRSNHRRRSSTSRPIPAGENPLIFGAVSPRRVSKSLLGQGQPQNTSVEVVAPSEAAPYITEREMRTPALSLPLNVTVTGPTPEVSPSKHAKSHPHSLSNPSPVISPTSSSTPITSALRPLGSLKRKDKHSPPKTVTYQDEIDNPREVRKSLGKRKSEEMDVVLDLEHGGGDGIERRRGSIRISDPSPSHVGHATGTQSVTSPRRSSSKRIKLSPQTQSHSLSDTQPFQHDHAQETTASTTVVGHGSSSRPQSPPATPLPSTRPASLQPSTKAKSARSRNSLSFIPIGSSSQRSLPLSAIVSPRPPSVARISERGYGFSYAGGPEEGLYMRDPRGLGSVGWRVRVTRHPLSQFKTREESQKQQQQNGGLGAQYELSHLPTPLPGLLFYPGVLCPLLWFVGALLKFESRFHETGAIRKGKGIEGRAVEGEGGKGVGVEPWEKGAYERGRMEEKAFKAWRDRCRFMALLSLVTYLPVIVALAVFVPK